jgi:hypothetical protein
MAVLIGNNQSLIPSVSTHPTVMPTSLLSVRSARNSVMVTGFESGLESLLREHVFKPGLLLGWKEIVFEEPNVIVYFVATQ